MWMNDPRLKDIEYWIQIAPEGSTHWVPGAWRALTSSQWEKHEDGNRYILDGKKEWVNIGRLQHFTLPLGVAERPADNPTVELNLGSSGAQLNATDYEATVRDYKNAIDTLFAGDITNLLAKYICIDYAKRFPKEFVGAHRRGDRE